ncbi:MFS transporter [Streptomyces sp. NPDC090306]|uniref:MFS transporter n=1 Tax=Streptomyces sp. NPDC090306 TaxID=3365961 RepID=UPI0037F99C04
MSFLRPRFKGERALIAGIAIDATGSGMYVPFNLIFFSHVTDLPLAQIGLVLTVTSLIALAALPLGGAAVDRFGALKVLIVLYLVRALGFALYPLAHSLPAFAVLALVTAAGTRAAPSTLQARFAELLSGTDRDRMQALSRSLGNAGLGGGTLIASLIIATAGDHGYVIAAWLNAGSFVVAALLATRTPASPHADRNRPSRKGGYRLVAKDPSFLLLALSNLSLAIGYTSLTILLPVFAIKWLHVPQGLIGSAFIVNTALCATLGVPVAALARRRFRTRIGMAQAGAGLFVLAFVGQIVLGTVRPENNALAMTVLLTCVVVATFGELVHSPAASTLAQAAAPAALRGRYLAAYQSSWALANALAPSVFTALVSQDGRLPWLVIAVTAVLGAFMLRLAERRLPADAVYFEPPAAKAEPAEAEAATG